MSVVSYTAKRSFTAGAVLDDPIVLDLLLRDDMTMSRSPVRSESVAIGGARESIYDRDNTVWNIRTQVLFGQDSDDMVMFLDSAEDGHTLQFAPYDASTDSPINYRNGVLQAGGYTQAREISTGTPAVDGFSYAFQIVEIP